ncbi:MAG: hypothetical protein R3E96_10900 [Planctomycetota bacterium]
MAKPAPAIPYNLGTSRLPLYLESGRHHLYFRLSRPPFRGQLEPTAVPVFLEGVDTTQPDVLRGEGGRYWVGQMISNASATTRTGWSIVATAVLPASAPSLDSITTPLHPAG